MAYAATPAHAALSIDANAFAMTPLPHSQATWNQEPGAGSREKGENVHLFKAGEGIRINVFFNCVRVVSDGGGPTFHPKMWEGLCIIVKS